MLYGTIMNENGWYTVQVEEFPRRKYLYYTKREAISRYLAEFNLKGKHIRFN